MKFCSVFALVALLFGTGAFAAWGNGWGDDVDWSPSLEAALEKQKATSLPIIAIISNSYCGACKNLKPLVAASSSFAEAAKNFIAVSLVDANEPKGAEFAPDGGYIPRIVFLGPDGKVVPSLINSGRKGEKYQYFYTDSDSIVQTMNTALATFKSADKEEM